MDRRERYRNEEELLRIAMRRMQSRLWTALPGIVEKFDALKNTVEVQPAINGKLRAADGSLSSLQMPKIPDVPVVWIGGGGVTLTFPIASGDECLLIFAARSIDSWWSQGGVKDPTDIRMHNLSDAFAIVGLRSQPRVFAVSTTEAVVRNDAGDAYYKFNPTTKAMAILMPGGVNINGVTIDASGNVHSPATITADTDVIASTKSGKTHTHNDPQGGVTAGPN